VAIANLRYINVLNNNNNNSAGASARLEISVTESRTESTQKADDDVVIWLESAATAALQRL